MHSTTRFVRRSYPLLALLAGATLTTGALAATPQRQSATLIHTQDGPIQGSVKAGIRVFTRIPFAAPPVGPLRFRPPQPVAPWGEPLLANQPIPNCIQFGGSNPRPQSEDCLYLSVWAPARATPARPMPVMVWIFGSGLYTNGPQDYDGASLARHGVLLVTINHRLGLLGTMVDRSLDEPGALSGNNALRDVQASLRWVQRNIRQFGGDPANVTVFGDSAGARLAMAQMISPPSRGLFAKVIGQSVGGMDRAGWRGGQVVEPRDVIEAAQARAVLKALGCADSSDTAACLRAAPVAALVGTGLGPTIVPLVSDPELLPLPPQQAFKSGQFTRVPVMMGTGLNEGAFQIVPDAIALGRKLTEEDLPPLYKKYFKSYADVAAAGYAVSKYGAPDLAIMHARTDIWQACPTDFLLRAIAPHAPVYGFEVTAPDLAQAWPGKDITNIPNSPSHGSEVAYVFGSKHGERFTGRHARLSAMFQRYWTNFAKYGTPDPGGRLWPRYRPGTEVLLSLKDVPTITADYAQRHNCDYMREHGMVRY